MTSKLPDKPSELILAGLEDLEKIEMLPEVYRVDMGTWHTPDTVCKVCDVCLAGAMMAMRLGVKPTEWVTSSLSFPAQDSKKLRALDLFRRGLVWNGCKELGADFRLAYVKVLYPVTPYHRNPVQFKEDMRAIASTLEGAGV